MVSLIAVRNALAVAVTAASIAALGADLTQTAYTAAHTAQTVVLAGNA
ncbi:MAG TPA: hypothetical protein VGC96_05130 [Candidatus Elarobacter sp.]